MSLVRGAWKLLVGVKDALVLIFMLIFFGLLYAAMSASPNRAISEGALVLDLDGTIVEQPEEVDPFAALVAGSVPIRQFRLRDVVRALDEAATDDRVKAVVLDLDGFMGGGQVALATVGDAIQRVRDANKPVLAYATGYSDAGYLLAAHASEIWIHPMGLAVFTGPGGSRLYYKGLIDELGVNAHVYRVGAYKAAVEPYLREDQSPEAREASLQLASALWEGWQRDVAAARPKARLAAMIANPTEAMAARAGNMAQAALATGVVDKIGDRTALGTRIAEIAGGEDSKPAGWFKQIGFDDWIAAHPLPTEGEAIGVVTVAGVITDGEAGPGTAGGDTIASQILKGIADDELKALVVRVDSPGGSALASEQIRLALLEAKKKGLPVVISMGSVAASGGYWVATAGDHIFAEPATITGSIGVFGVLPTIEDTLAKVGITTDGIRTTPLSGQPDLLGGTTPEFDALMQLGVENIYTRFVGMVSDSRDIPVARVNEIAQGRVWDGGSARQLGLIDGFGSLDAAIAEAVRRAKLDPENVHTRYLEPEPDFFATLIAGMGRDDEDQVAVGNVDLLTTLGRQRGALLMTAIDDLRMLVEGPAIQARCLECPVVAAAPSRESRTLWTWLIDRATR